MLVTQCGGPRRKEGRGDAWTITSCIRVRFSGVRLTLTLALVPDTPCPVVARFSSVRSVRALLLEPTLLGGTVCSILPRCLTGRAVLLGCVIRTILARRLPGRTILFIPFRLQTLFGLGALLLRVAFARSLPGSLGAAAVLRCLADAAIRSFVVARRPI